MKNIVKLVCMFLSAAVMVSCEKKIEQITYQSGTAPVLTASQQEVNLSFADADNVALMLQWTNPEYTFSTGVNSHDVTYLVEIDTAGANFTNPNRKTISISKDLSTTFTHAMLNDYLLNQLTLKVAMPHDIQIRVTASLSNSALPLESNVLDYTMTPYATPPKVTPPSSGELFIVGSATPGGWDNPVPEPAQQLTKVSETMYEITLPLSSGNSYLLLPVNGSWDAKYGGTGENNKNNVNGDDFKFGGSDLLAPAESATYKIEVDFQRGKFTLTKQ